MVVNDGAIDKTLLFDVELLGIGDNAKAIRAQGTWVAGPLAEDPAARAPTSTRAPAE